MDPRIIAINQMIVFGVDRGSHRANHRIEISFGPGRPRCLFISTSPSLDFSDRYHAIYIRS